MLNKKLAVRIVMSFMGLLIITAIGLYAYLPSIADMFRLNKELQEDGYYMAEFEFKMIGILYYLDRGEYIQAISRLDRVHKQLTSRKGLIKVPRFTDKRQEMDFYLNLQNPRTGAFMDDSYPLCTYLEPTLNVLIHLDALAKATGRPLKLKYPLKFLDSVNTPEKLKAHLDDLSAVGWIVSKMAQTPYILAQGFLGNYREQAMLEENNRYHFSAEWKQSVLRWFYENQDTVTGFWGPRSRYDGRLLNSGDLSITASIIKRYVDENGNDIYASFPLRHKKRMFETALRKLSEPMPAADQLDKWHEWDLKTGKGIHMLTSYLWKDASQESRERAGELIRSYVKTKFDKYYITNEGAFSYYPGSEHATLDGTGSGVSIFANLGAFSTEKQRRLWGDPRKTCTDLGNYTVSRLAGKDFNVIGNYNGVNSLRFYSSIPDPGDYVSKAACIFYPKDTSVLDIVELTLKVRKWLDATPQSMGNWVSRENILLMLATIRCNPVRISRGEIPLEQVNEILSRYKTLTVVGFDVLQVPRCRITFKLKTKPDKRHF